MTGALPGVLAEIAAVAGAAAALAIAARHGGTRIYIPASAGDTHWLVELVGREAADRLCEHFAVEGRRGASVEIPLHVGGTYRQYLRAVAETVHKHDDGTASESELARRAGITARSVRRHRARHRGTKSRQGRLL